MECSIEKIKYSGRFYFGDPKGPIFAWTASSISTRFKGNKIYAGFCKVNEKENDNWINVIIDNKDVVSIRIDHDGIYTLAENMDDNVHEIEIFKRTEASFGELQFTGFKVDGGEIISVPKNKKKLIEFIGDSITCGFGNESSAEEVEFLGSKENGYMSWAAIASRMLNADCHVIAWSGMGLYRDFTGLKERQMNVRYFRTLPNRIDSIYDFIEQPNVVVINLGTNDLNLGIPKNELFIGEYKKFLNKIRNNYKKAVIYCILGPLIIGNELIVIREYIENMVNDFNLEGDSNIRYLELPEQDGTLGYGANGHPSLKTHEQMAEKLVERLKTDLKW